MNPLHEKYSSPARLAILLMLLADLAAIVLFRDAYHASNFNVVPDSVEYAVGGYNLATEGEYCISVNGRRLPPRYPPGFSALVTAPAYRLLGREPGNAIYPVTLMAVMGVLTAFLIGRRFAGDWGGMLSGLALLMLPDYRDLGREIMTDVPCVFLVLLGCLLYLQARAAAAPSPRLLLAAGSVAAVAASFRPACMALVLPFFVLVLTAPGSFPGKVKRLAALLAMPALVVISTLAYNQHTFQSPFRSGYNLWCAVPLDYPSLAFSISYLRSNLEALFLGGLPAWAFALALLALLQSRRPPVAGAPASPGAPLRSCLGFAAWALSPILLMHLFYFFPTPRFFLPVTALLAVIAAALAGKYLQPRASENAILPLLIVLVAAAAVVRFTSSLPPPHARLAVERLRTVTPDNAVIVSSLDTASLEFYLCKNTRRRIVPLTRLEEYASKLVCFRRVPRPDPPPSGWRDHRCPGLRNAGAEEAIPWTAVERPDKLAEEIRKGVPVYLDASHTVGIETNAVIELARFFYFTPRADYCYQLSLAPTP